MSAEEKADFQPFLMERMMSKWENVVDYNLLRAAFIPRQYANWWTTRQ